MSPHNPHLVPTVIAADARDPDDSPEVEVDVDRWQRLALAVLVHHGSGGELTLTFVGVDDIAELNIEHMGKHGATDVLSFPLDDHPHDDHPLARHRLDGVPTLLGDVVISPAVASGQCVDHAGTVDDELALLVVHGVLHVLGHDHSDPEEAAAMRSLELDLLRRYHWNGSAPPAFRQTHDDEESDR